MNYFAHGRRFIESPYRLAGTAVPDWLNVVNRRAKARSRSAVSFLQHSDPAVAAVADGIVQHHFDDGWFHQTRAFAELNLQFAVELRGLLGEEAGFRPSFLGHILVELLLDAELIDESPGLLDDYYRALAAIDPFLVTRTVDAIATESVAMLSAFIPRFCEVRFLYDYSDDARLLFRLNNVMKRVHLPELPLEVGTFFPTARALVRQRRDELLAGEDSSRPA